jgi:cation diffusion facilitator family transporter
VRRHDEARDRAEANRAIMLSAVGLALTGGLELVLALYTGSVALLGDSLHNLADVSTSAVVFVGFRVSKRPPSSAYPYGYERAEDLAGLGIAVVIWASAVFAGWESYEKLISRGGTSHLGAGMGAAVLGMTGNFAVSKYKARVGRRIQSVTLQAEATHSWLDVISSFGALVGLAAVAAGHPWGDPIAGGFVTLFICRVGWEVTSQIVRHLMDGIEPEHLLASETAARSVPGVLSAVARGRWMGRSLALEVEVELPPETTLETAQRIGTQVEHAVHEAVSSARQVRWTARACARNSTDATAGALERASRITL